MPCFQVLKVDNVARIMNQKSTDDVVDKLCRETWLGCYHSDWIFHGNQSLESRRRFVSARETYR